MAGQTNNEAHGHHRYTLFLYDLLLLLLVDTVLLILYPSNITKLEHGLILLQYGLSAMTIFSCRLLLGIYNRVWRYADTKAYLWLILSDGIALIVYFVIQFILKVTLDLNRLSLMRTIGLVAANLLLTMAIRMIYQYLYQSSSRDSRIGNVLRKLIATLTGIDIRPSRTDNSDPETGNKINIAIVGAGRVGVSLAEELKNNPASAYRPCCFIDVDREKIGRSIGEIPVLAEENATAEVLCEFPIQEIVIALPQMAADRKKELYVRYLQTGCKIKAYDYPMTQSVENGKRQLREFDVSELLFRPAKDFLSDKTKAFYRDKVVLISGGGGSIGSELCRQIARMEPKQLVILDVYENNAYDIQQELKIAYGVKLNLAVEIATICDREEVEQVFERYHPQIVVHAAAHKHVPLMEHNCCEAVRNNVFGTLNMVECAEKYGVEKFIMVSTDKAVNPTNVMGATKRVCEMIVQGHNGGKTSFSATRFGNVLGSNGSVIPLFRRQITEGGPVTITDKRIVRFFMTIPEASQLVLTSGAMANAGELFVLDMGEPVEILKLAEEMIRLSGLEPYKDIEIRETGLRPGEKLWEELLMKNEDLSRTENEKIFVEKDTPLSRGELAEILGILKEATETNDDDQVREALHRVVPTYKTPEEVNATAAASRNSH